AAPRRNFGRVCLREIAKIGWHGIATLLNDREEQKPLEADRKRRLRFPAPGDDTDWHDLRLVAGHEAQPLARTDIGDATRAIDIKRRHIDGVLALVADLEIDDVAMT